MAEFSAKGKHPRDESAGEVESHPSKKVKLGNEVEHIKNLINSSYVGVDAEEKLTKDFHAGEPFAHIQLTDFFDSSFLEEVKEELAHLDYNLKSNDLYEFYQTDALQTCTKPKISQLRDLLYSEFFRSWLSKITGIKNLKETQDMSAAIYSDANYLLCHDDELEGRRIAYIIYLVPPDWEESDGGELALFNTSRTCEPKEIVKKLFPKWNSLSFFSVTLDSFHQVSQVLSSKGRMSISGWLYGDPFERPAPLILPQPPFFAPVDEDAALLAKWLNPTYLNPSNQKNIQAVFLNESFIELQDFLNPDMYKTVSQELFDHSVQSWTQRGPPNKQWFLSIDSGKEVGSALPELARLFKSTAFFNLLKEITQLELVKVAPQIRCFQNNHYTLLHDEDPETSEDGLDCMLVFLPALPPQEKKKKPKKTGKKKKQPEEPEEPEWFDDWGGYVHYTISTTAKPEEDEESDEKEGEGSTSEKKESGSGGEEEDEEEEDDDEEEDVLPALMPKSNSLSLVYRTKGTMRFVKMVTHRAPCARYDFSMIYREKQE